MSESAEESGSLLLNLVSEPHWKKKKKVDHDALKDDDEMNQHEAPIIQMKSWQPTKRDQLRKSKFKHKQRKFTTKTSPIKNAEGVITQRSLATSSLFTSNPVVEPLIVKKQKSISEPLFSTKTFDEIDLHPHLVSCLKQRLNVVQMTNVQEKTIPLLLAGKDALVKSCTGTGKTLAYAIPIVQKLQMIEPKIKRADGVFALIIVPTRELALQCYEIFSTLTKAFTWIVPGYLIGGEKKKSEKARLRKGINILISTPGRLLDHLEHTANLSLQNIAWLVIDEADVLLELKFEASVIKIISKCFQHRQSTLLSATLTKEIENLAGISLSNPVRIDISTTVDKEQTEFHDFAVPASLKQFVVVVPPKQRLIVLSSFIVDNHLKGNFKGLIFMCSQDSVDFHHSLLSDVLASYLVKKGSECKFFKLHGHMKQEDRIEVFNRFKSVKEGVLFCTDVAARGWDMPYVDWIVQYTAPHSVEIYVHRVGRTARIGKKGNALLFLLPSETRFTNLLADHKINFEEITVDQCLKSLLTILDSSTFKGKNAVQDCATALQTKYEKTVYEEGELYKCAKEAFASYVQAYASYPKNIRDILPFKELHLGHVAKSFCLREAPSTLGCRLPNIKFQSQNYRKNHSSKPPLKRKVSNVISEYDSGLALLDMERKSKKKKS